MKGEEQAVPLSDSVLQMKTGEEAAEESLSNPPSTLPAPAANAALCCQIRQSPSRPLKTPKCTAEPFEIPDDYDAKLRGRCEAFLPETGTRNAIHLTMVSANGLKRNANAFDIPSVVTLDDLFAR